MSTISVIVPVLNEAANLRRCIEAITGGTKQPLEVIVADGGSNDDTVVIAKSCGALVVDNPKGSAAAGRNVGALAAQGSIFAFTDGDCIPDSTWIQSIEEVFERRNPDIVAGKIVAHEPENHYEAYWNELAWEVLMEFGDEEFDIAEKDLRHSVITANCAYMREAFEDLGGFDEWFGNNAEDVDLCWRAIDAGKRIVYDPSPCVRARGVTDLNGIKSKSFRNGVSSSKLQKRYGGRINYDLRVYRMLADNLRGQSTCEWPCLERSELIWHLLGKYYGSVRYGVINV